MREAVTLVMSEGLIGRRENQDRIRPLLRTALACALFLTCAACVAQHANNSAKTLPTFTTAHAVHSLTPEEAARQYPVHLRAVATYYDPYIDSRHGALFVNDATGSIFVAVPSRPILPISAGTQLDVTGVSGSGDYAPIVQRAQLKVLGQSRIPQEAPAVSMAQLLSPAEDGQWIEVEGLVHAVRLTPENVILDIATLGGQVSATTLREAGKDYEPLIDSLIRLHANSAPVFNRRRQLVGVHLFFPGLSQVGVIEAAPADPFALPVVPIPDLLRFTPNLQFRHRVHVQGTLTLQWPGQILCVQQASSGLCMQTAQTTRVNVGDRVDIVGFPAAHDYKATLENATIRVAGSGSLPSPKTTTALQALRGDTDGELVAIDGVLLGEDRATSNPTLFLRDEQSLFSAMLPPSSTVTGPLPWKEGSRLRIHGISSVQVDAQDTTLQEGAVRTQSVRLLLRSPADIEVLEAPSWWTPTRALLTLAVVAAIAIAAFFWIVLLQRRVEQQTLVIRRNEDRLRHLAEHDALTNLPNRILLNDRLEMARARVKRFRSVLAVLMIDLDRFKEVNDSLGHLAGDQLLCWVAERLVALVRKTDTVARIGGDEFIVLLEDLQSCEDAGPVASKIVSSLSAPFEPGSRQVSISVSVGVCTFPEEGVHADDLLQNADVAMYQAKAQGRNSFSIFKPEMTSGEPASRAFSLRPNRRREA
jgi:diguanylate cyclase (GGDEF)-like protein